MKLRGIALFALALTIYQTTSALSASADILCQRAKAKRPSNRSVLNIKIVKTTCPAGFVKVGTYLTSEDVDTQVNNVLTNTSSVGPQGEKGEKGDKGDTGATGAQGAQGEQGLPGTPGERGATGERGETGSQGEKGDTGPQGKKGIVAIDSCQQKALSRSGVLDETQTIYCNNPENEFVLHVGYSIDKDDSHVVREILEFQDSAANSYTHPVGATIRAFRLNGITPYTLTATILCCPINDEPAIDPAV